MLLAKRNRVMAIISLALVSTICALSFWHWQSFQSYEYENAQLGKELNAAMQVSQQQTSQLLEQLKLLREKDGEPSLHEYAPVKWLDALQSALTGVRASVLVDKTEVLSEFQEFELLRVPIELELQSSNSSALLLVLNGISNSLGGYTSAENCVLAHLQRLGVDSGYRVRCRLLKYAYRKGAEL